MKLHPPVSFDRVILLLVIDLRGVSTCGTGIRMFKLTLCIISPIENNPTYPEKAAMPQNILTAQPMRITARTKFTTLSKHKH